METGPKQLVLPENPTSAEAAMDVLEQDGHVQVDKPAHVTTKKWEGFDAQSGHVDGYRKEARVLEVTIVTGGKTSCDGKDYPTGIFMSPIDVGNIPKDGIRYLYTIEVNVSENDMPEGAYLYQ